MQAALLHNFGEFGILGQKSVARVDGVGAGHLGRTDQSGNVVVALAGGRRADAHFSSAKRTCRASASAVE